MKESPNYWHAKVKGSELAYAFNDTYNTGLTVAFNATDESLAAIAKKYDMEAPDQIVLDNATGRCWWHKKIGGCFIAIKPVRPSVMFSTLAHELVHWIDYLYDDRNINHNSNHDEPTAYLVGWANQHLYHTAVDAAEAWNRKAAIHNAKLRKKKK